MDQQAIGDCLLLATLQAYSQSEDGRQLLRDNIRLNDARDGFIVTLYDNGQPVDVNVTDYYTNGLQGQQTAPPHPPQHLRARVRPVLRRAEFGEGRRIEDGHGAYLQPRTGSHRHPWRHGGDVLVLVGR